MKVLLIKDVYNLGRAGEVKKVADGYARNFLLPKKMAVAASVGAMKQIQKIEAAAAKQREILNEEMSGLAQQISALELHFKAKVGDTGKLYGSITQQTIIDEVNAQLKVNLDRHQMETQPLREVGEHMVHIRLTFDLVPEVKVIVESEDAEKSEEESTKKKRSAKIEEIVQVEEGGEIVDAVEAVEAEAAQEVVEVDEPGEADVTDEPTQEEASEPEESRPQDE
jgi:large subunit ribosomal protein L9